MNRSEQTAVSCLAREKLRTLRVGLLGLGTVGQGLCTLLHEKAGELAHEHGLRFCISEVLVRDMGKARALHPPGALLLDKGDAFIQSDFDLVVECMGGVEPAGAYTASFLERGIPVVTANKALLAEKGEALSALAARHNTSIRFEASVAAGIPVIGVIERALQSSIVFSVTAILNGTSNYVVSRLTQKGDRVEEALREAQRLGYAEADPFLDLSGTDAAQKLVILTRTLGRTVAMDRIEVSSLTHLKPEDARRARAFGFELKPLAYADLNRARGFVAPGLVRKTHPLAGVWDVTNGVHLSGEPLGSLFLSGPGAGALPTAASLLDDMLAHALGYPGSTRSRLLKDRETSAEKRLSTRWFLTLEPGEKAVSVDDILDFVAGTGMVFRELRELYEGRDLVMAGLTTKTSPESIERLAARLKAAEAVERFRAFRVVEEV